MFRGNHPATVDDKGRLKLPTAFRAIVDRDYGADFFITSKDGTRAEVYPMKEWEAIEAKVAQLPSMSTARQKFAEATNYYGHEVSLDAGGRLLLPQKLREKANLKGEVAVIGGQNWLIVVNNEAMEQRLTTNGINDDDAARLAELGI